MKSIVIRSNHGNHTNHNRKWDILNTGFPFDTKEEAAVYLGNVADELDEQYDEEIETFVQHGPLEAFEHDLRYYKVITQEEYANGIFGGGHMGYANSKIKEIFDGEASTMKKYRIISVAGFTDKNTATLWDGSSIITATSYDAEDFDFGDDAEKQLEYCKAFIKHKEETEGWIPGIVTCWIDEYEIEPQDNG